LTKLGDMHHGVRIAKLELILFLPAVIYRKGMGLGDVKMAALVGLMTVFPKVIVAVFGGIMLGGLVAIILLVFKIKSREGILFGPYLSLATIFTFFYGSRIIHWYLYLEQFA
jgi:leader peptidase (prepilin peptidase) / N-methyltransferase